MQYRTLGKTGLNVSAIGLGASQLGRPAVDEQQAERVLNRALDLGINFIDTAAMYKLSEERIGRYLHRRRDEFIIATKCGDYNVVKGGAFRTVKDYTPQGILRTIDASRRKLRTDVIDIVQFHGLPSGPDERRAAIEALLTTRERGWVRFVGASIGEPPGGEDDAWSPDVKEFTYNILEQEAARAILPRLDERRMGAIAKRPIANAVYLLPARPEGTYYAGSWDRAQRYDVSALAAAAGMSPVKFALCFALSHRGVHTAIVGTTSVEHLEANVRACEGIPLPQETLRQARRLFEEAFAKDGDSQAS